MGLSCGRNSLHGLIIRAKGERSGRRTIDEINNDLTSCKTTFDDWLESLKPKKLARFGHAGQAWRRLERNIKGSPFGR
jgi:hypothetical protein